MISLRQADAFVWTVRLGTLSRAAQRLNIAQPTISKRIQEMEVACRFNVFVKSGRSVELTTKGHELYKLCERIVHLAEKVSLMQDGPSTRIRTLRVGVTELTVHTWLPRLVRTLGEGLFSSSPRVVIDHGTALADMLSKGDIDFAVCPSPVDSVGLSRLPLTNVRLALMGSPRLCAEGKVYNGSMLSDYTYLSLGQQIGVVGSIERWMQGVGYKPRETIEINSISALVGMTVAGIGLSVLPYELFRPLVVSSKLIEVATASHQPDLPYDFVCRKHDEVSSIGDLYHLVKEVCDFGQNNQV